jgi:hypothetical protein
MPECSIVRVEPLQLRHRTGTGNDASLGEAVTTLIAENGILVTEIINIVQSRRVYAGELVYSTYYEIFYKVHDES